MNFYTRSTHGMVEQHESLEKALMSFISEDGYRIDFEFDDDSIIHIHRDEFGEAQVFFTDSFVHPGEENVLSMESYIDRKKGM